MKVIATAASKRAFPRHRDHPCAREFPVGHFGLDESFPGSVIRRKTVATLVTTFGLQQRESKRSTRSATVGIADPIASIEPLDSDLQGKRAKRFWPLSSHSGDSTSIPSLAIRSPGILRVVPARKRVGESAVLLGSGGRVILGGSEG